MLFSSNYRIKDKIQLYNFTSVRYIVFLRSVYFPRKIKTFGGK